MAHLRLQIFHRRDEARRERAALPGESAAQTSRIDQRRLAPINRLGIFNRNNECAVELTGFFGPVESDRATH